MFIKQCVVCNQSFNAYASGFEKRKCCSRKCVKIWKSQTVTQDSNPSWTGGNITKKCLVCGADFSVKKSHEKRRHHCSKKCYWASKVFSVRGEYNPRWQGGKSFEPYPITFNKEFKESIRARDNYTCAICKEYGKDVHHINYVKNDTTPENCITLCRSCHVKTNSNREYWVDFFKNLPRYM